MAAGHRLLVAVAAIGVGVASAPLDAQRSGPTINPAHIFEAVPHRIPPLHISGETRMRLRDASLSATHSIESLLQTAEPAPARSPERIRRAVVTLTMLAASAMVLLLIAGWLFLRRRQS